jgi:DNA-directed RNA polymerase beta subunit
LYHDATFNIAESIIGHTTFSPHHRASFNHLLATQLPLIISEYSPIQTIHPREGVAHRVHLDNLRFARPAAEEVPGVMNAQIGKELFATKMTLLSDVLLDLRHEVFASDPQDASRMMLQETKLYTNVPFFQLPVMGGTELTHDFDDMDPISFDRCQGTLVTNGYPKAIFLQVQRRSNFPYVTGMHKTSRYVYCCETRSGHRTKLRSSSSTKLYLTREKAGVTPRMVAMVPYVSKRLPITMLFRLMGIDNLRDMLRLVVGGHESTNYVTMARAKAMIFCNSMQASREDLLVYMATKLGGAASTGSAATVHERSRAAHVASMINLVSCEIYPHIGAVDLPDVLFRKATFLGRAIAKVLAVAAGELSVDLIDDGQHKRYNTAGQTLAIKLRQLVRNYTKMLSASFTRACENGKHVNVPEYLRATNISRPLRAAMARGNFSLNMREDSTMAGVSQVVNSMNRLSRLGHMSTVNLPLSRDGSQSEARQLRGSKWGLECAGHTPDGRSIGLVRHTAALADFRRGHNQEALSSLVSTVKGVYPLTSEMHACVVVVNDDIVGRCAQGPALIEHLRLLREHLVIPADVSLSYDSVVDQVTVQADDGDCVRPILRVDRLLQMFEVVGRYGAHQPMSVFPELQAQGVIEYVNKVEENAYQVAHSFRQLVEEGATGNFTHVEVDPTLAMYGALIGTIPFSHCNQGPRNLYWGSMGPAAIGAMHPMFERYQLDVQTHTLDYPQKPLTSTLTSRLLMGDDCDESVVQMYNVAILPAGGLNQEDAVVMKRSSIERGLAASTKFSILRDVEAEHGRDRERFSTPPLPGEPLVGRKRASTHALEGTTGLPKKGARVQPGDMIIGKLLDCSVQRVNPVTGKIETTSRIVDRSTIWRGNGEAIVHSVCLIDRGGLKSVIVRMRESQAPRIGDKFSSVHAQKGVLADLWADEDMPFNSDGITPDILFLSHGITSRMTIGQLREMIANHIATVNGLVFDATAFRMQGVHETSEQARLGACMHTFTCGKTGRTIGRGFMGLCSYTLQRHKVVGKIHARATGPRNAITGQAVEGRANHGGLKISPMEVNEFASYGAAATIKETMTKHDGRDVCLCACGKIVDPPSTSNARSSGCQDCGGSVRRVFIPRITLVLHWELAAAGVDMRFHIDPQNGHVSISSPP